MVTNFSSRIWDARELIRQFLNEGLWSLLEQFNLLPYFYKNLTTVFYGVDIL